MPGTDRQPPRGHATGPPPVVQVLARHALVCEYASMTRQGHPVTWAVTPYPGEDGGTVDVSTGLAYPAKADRARRDPRAALLFSSTTEAELPGAPVVLVRGLATVRDRDLQAATDRYVRLSRAKMPLAYRGIPAVLIPRLDWYFARIWVHVTPLEVLVWPGGRLGEEPERWQAPEGTAAPPSDPPPRGPALPSRLPPTADWRAAADRADALGTPPVVTLVGPDGGPVPLLGRDVRRTNEGYLLRTPAGVPPAAGPACLTVHRFAPGMTEQENVVLTGTAEPTGDGVDVRVERALPSVSIAGRRVGRTWRLLRQSRDLRARLRAEAARRGQTAPRVRV